jgi:peptide/nickel transport system permease protein
MRRYVLIRCLEALVAIWGVLTIVFVATRLTGDPAILLLPTGATPEQIAELRHELGLDRPLWDQYAIFIADAARGDFGTSFQHHRPALDVVLERFPATVRLALTALVLGTLLGLGAGMIAALKRGTLVEAAAMTVALLGQATPVFWLGIVLILVFAVYLQWLPAGGSETLAHLVLPAFTLAVFISAAIARLLRSSMIEVLKEDYVRTAWAKGLAPRVVYLRHAARAALTSVLTMLGIIAGELLGGAVIVETIFSWPGVGRLVVQAIEVKDFTVVQATVALVSTVFVLINFAVDVLYGVVDPRVRVER